MDSFSRELASTKENLSATQTIIFGTIREKLQATFDLAAQHRQMKKTGRVTEELGGENSKSKDEMVALTSQLMEILRANGLSSVEDFVNQLENSEEQIFTIYNEIQEKNEELEKLDLENRHLEQQLSDQVRTCCGVVVVR